MTLVGYSATLSSQVNFTIGALNQIISSNQNVAFSPYSLTLALAMCYIGAGGTTEIEFKKLLSPYMEKKEYLEFLNTSISTINLSSTNNTSIYIAEKLFVKSGYKVNKKFKKEVKKYLKATTENVDFSDSTNSVKKINNFISNATYGKINDLISSNDINSLTRVVLTNALFFKSQWKEKFDKMLTTNEDFYTTSTKKKSVEMLNKQGKLLYGSNENFHAIKIPYSNINSSFFLILPKERNMLYSLLNTFNSNVFLNLTHSIKRQSVDFSMPKFKVESSQSWKDPLIKMGLTSAFDDSANFSFMSSKNNLKIDAVLQKVYVDVNEEGTEAAAATGVIIGFKSSLIHTEVPIVVKADHPFLYFILYNNNILFSGLYQ
uniref:SERPIN domain-containing protein n=1 Tax=Strongyloides stercoralis TaxID=6248 RepID=A0A0K0E2X0_STRER